MTLLRENESEEMVDRQQDREADASQRPVLVSVTQGVRGRRGIRGGARPRAGQAR